MKVYYTGNPITANLVRLENKKAWGENPPSHGVKFLPCREIKIPMV